MILVISIAMNMLKRYLVSRKVRIVEENSSSRNRMCRVSLAILMTQHSEVLVVDIVEDKVN